MIVMQKLVKVDGKVRTDLNYPAGFMDVIELEKSDERFRMLYDTKGRFVLSGLDKEEAKFKMCRITGEMKQARGVPAVVTHDGRTLRYPDPIIKVHDTVKIDLATGKVRLMSAAAPAPALSPLLTPHPPPPTHTHAPRRSSTCSSLRWAAP